jgi:hypothetical protein
VSIKPYDSEAIGPADPMAYVVLTLDDMEDAVLLNRNYGLLAVVPRWFAEELVERAGGVTNEWKDYTGGERAEFMDPEMPMDARWLDASKFRKTERRQIA